MRTPRVEDVIVGEPAAASRSDSQGEVEVQNPRLAKVLREDELKSAIRASTARILELALMYGDEDPDPDIA
jgi:hypothetical protein